MTTGRISVFVFSNALFTCLTLTTCIVYQISESRSDDNARQKEYDENPRIRVKHMNNVINDTLTAKGRYANIEVVVEAFSETFVLSMHLNRHLFASTYVQKVIRKSGVSYLPINHTENNCYYIGKVKNQKNSVAAVSTCNGIKGYFTIGNFSYHVETHKNHSDRVYRMRENSQFLYGCGTKDSEFSQRLHFSSGKQRYKRSFAWPQDGDGRDKVLEVYIANDNAQFVDKGRDEYAVIQRAKDIANFASSSYQTLGIFFVLVGMEVWADTDRIPVRGSSADSTLSAWNTYRTQQINPNHYNDDAVLITRVQFDNRVIGKSLIGTICSNLYSSAVVVDASSSALAAGSTMAHEIGHNFGLIHDNNSYCSCPDGSGNCIMNPTAGSTPATNWSSCSIQQFNQGFQHGIDICLYDAPQTIYQPTVSTCGNGIIEDGEQCDCGRSPKQECNPSCCSSCKLIRPATCASGRCCNISICQIKDYGRLCRGSTVDCDLPEHCDGFNSTCPADTHRPDGTQCTVNGDSAYCYDGKCRSHNSQCGLLWGQGTSRSDTACYQRLNPAGEHYGNCGMRWLPSATFFPCQAKDVMCGKLLCATSSSQKLAYYQNYYLISPASLSQTTPCNSVIFDYGLKVQDPGLVPNGASCGDGQMCINQTCVSASSLQTFCTETCEDDEACNNLGQCQNQVNGDLPMPSWYRSNTLPPLPTNADVLVEPSTGPVFPSFDFSSSALSSLTPTTRFRWTIVLLLTFTTVIRCCKMIL